MNENDLVLGLRCRDPAAVRHLVDSYLPSVWRFVYVRANRDPHVAEDIVSETVLALIQAVANPATEFSNPGAWLRSVANHKLQDHYRAAARVQHLIDQAATGSPGVEASDAASHHQTQERRAAIRKAMDELPEPQRMALEWKYLDKLSVREIAGRLGTTEKAVESHLFRARRELRNSLKEPDVPAEPLHAAPVDNLRRENPPFAFDDSANSPPANNGAPRPDALEELTHRGSR